MRPVLFYLPFELPIYAYGAMLALSVIAGRVLAVRLAARAGIDARLADRCSLWKGGVVEMVRADPNRGSLGPLSTSQVIALATFLSAAAFLYLRSRTAERTRSTPAVTV